MARIYTGRGDEGETSLFGGGRTRKSDARVAAYGEVDELNAVIGWAARQSGESIAERLEVVQSDLFTLGAHLATPSYARSRDRLPELPGERVEQFEAWIDEIEAELGSIESFILPGGSEAGSALHVARTVCRRAERAVVGLSEAEKIEPVILIYLNRLSDLLFEFARLANAHADEAETTWRSDA